MFLDFPPRVSRDALFIIPTFFLKRWGILLLRFSFSPLQAPVSVQFRFLYLRGPSLGVGGGMVVP